MRSYVAYNRMSVFSIAVFTPVAKQLVLCQLRRAHAEHVPQSQADFSCYGHDHTGRDAWRDIGCGGGGLT
ncbi:hypothetical protein E2C01_051112 [Portunus trituberculatus]|uniref:Uncharacterized protein n=1 Tax=Portunus trituberculatus TaxID=210409 RepID=A0A5B7GJB0_PORTR|nr:hypothetical protein [Portunus trituberculatus]